MTSFPANSLISYNGSAYVSTAPTEDGVTPDADPAWTLLARGLPLGTHPQEYLVFDGAEWVLEAVPANSSLPVTATEGQVLTWNGTGWDAESLPAPPTPPTPPGLADDWQGTWSAT